MIMLKLVWKRQSGQCEHNLSPLNIYLSNVIIKYSVWSALLPTNAKTLYSQSVLPVELG